MADKYFVRGNQRKVAHNAREEVRLRWNGYREVASEEPVEATDADTTTTFGDHVAVDSWETNGGAVADEDEKPKRTPRKN